MSYSPYDVCDKWTEELDSKNSIDVIYWDFQKAFDSAPHKRMITKLEGYGIKGELLKWIECFCVSQKTASGNRWSSFKLV